MSQHIKRHSTTGFAELEIENVSRLYRENLCLGDHQRGHESATSQCNLSRDFTFLICKGILVAIWSHDILISRALAEYFASVSLF